MASGWCERAWWSAVDRQGPDQILHDSVGLGRTLDFL